MRERIRNELHIEVEGVDLTTVRNIEFYVRQGKCFFRTRSKSTRLNSSHSVSSRMPSSA